jgi:hypothetical protein
VQGGMTASYAQDSNPNIQTTFRRLPVSSWLSFS